MRRLDPKECAVLVIDVQEKLAAAMPPAQMSELTRAASVLIEGAALLGAKVIATEQYPAGLGPTIPAIADKLSKAGAPTLAKMDFSACDSSEFERALAQARASPPRSRRCMARSHSSCSAARCSGGRDTSSHGCTDSAQAPNSPCNRCTWPRSCASTGCSPASSRTRSSSSAARASSRRAIAMCARRNSHCAGSRPRRSADAA